MVAIKEWILCDEQYSEKFTNFMNATINEKVTNETHEIMANNHFDPILYMEDIVKNLNNPLTLEDLNFEEKK